MSINGIKKGIALEQTLNPNPFEDEATTGEENMIDDDGWRNTVISFNCKFPTYFFKHGNGNYEFVKIKHDAELEESSEPIDMQIAKNYLESAFTSAINLHRTIDWFKNDEINADKMLKHLKNDAEDVTTFLRTFCKHLNIEMRYICTDEDWFDGPVNYISLFNASIPLSKSLGQLQANIELMINVLKFTCEQGCGAYRKNPHFDEFQQYCTFVSSCLNYKPIAA